MPKNITLFIDGTYNKSLGEGHEENTNVIKLFDTSDESDLQRRHYIRTQTPAPKGGPVVQSPQHTLPSTALEYSPFARVVYYVDIVWAHERQCLGLFRVDRHYSWTTRT